jgi:hypothetical protein
MLYDNKEIIMYKKSSFIIALLIIFNNFSIHTSQEENTARGIALFAGTAIVAKQWISHKKRTQDEAAIDVQKIVRGRQAREQAKILKNIHLKQKQDNAAIKIQNKYRQKVALNKLNQLHQKQAETENLLTQAAITVEEQECLAMNHENFQMRAFINQQESQAQNLRKQQAALKIQRKQRQKTARNQLNQLRNEQAVQISKEQAAVQNLLTQQDKHLAMQNELLTKRLHQKKYVPLFPHFSEELLKLEPFKRLNNGAYGWISPKYSLHSKTELSEKDINLDDTIINQTIRDYTLQPKSIAEVKKNITVVYIPGTYTSMLHGSLERHTLAMQDEVLAFAKKITLAEHAQVNVLFYQWDGSIDEEKRQAAGKQLATYLQAIPDNHEIITLSHSHGGNVALHAAQALKMNNKKIDLAVLFGCPYHDRQIAIHENNVKTILNIHSDGDFTGAAGSFLQTANAWSIFQPDALTTTTSLRKETDNTINVQIKIEGTDLNHRETGVEGLKMLDTIMDCITKKEYPKGTDIIIDKNSSKIIACLDPRFNHPHANADQRSESKIIVQQFEKKYGNAITTQKTMQEKYDGEIGKHMQSNLCEHAVSIAAGLIHDPRAKIIQDEIDIIESTKDFSIQTRLLHQLRARLQDKYADLDDQTLQYQLQHHKKYNEIKNKLQKFQQQSEFIKQGTRTGVYSDWTSDEIQSLRQAANIRKKFLENNMTILDDAITAKNHIEGEQIKKMLGKEYLNLDKQTQELFLSSLPCNIEDLLKKSLAEEYDLIEEAEAKNYSPATIEEKQNK